ncbi:MAG: iron-sulfur cluster assembly protein [Actinomycetota bacterium]
MSAQGATCAPPGVDRVDSLAEDLAATVRAAVHTVDDPEYPGLSIVDLGLLEWCEVTGDGRVSIGLVPTFSGCPALGMIAEDVRVAVSAVPAISNVEVRWLTSPVWSTDRVSERGRAALADQFTVAVEIGAGRPTCPRCGNHLSPRSMFGPSRCRSVSRCTACSETVEVMRA